MECMDNKSINVRNIVSISIINGMEVVWNLFHLYTPKIFKFMIQCLNEMSNNLFVISHQFWWKYLDLNDNFKDLKYYQSYLSQISPILIKQSRIQCKIVSLKEEESKIDQKICNESELLNEIKKDEIPFILVRIRSKKVIEKLSSNNQISDIFVPQCIKSIKKVLNSTDFLVCAYF